MESVQIETRFSNGQGSIEVRPSLDDSAQAIVSTAELNGISCIVEGGDNASMAYIYGNGVHPDRLDKEADRMAAQLRLVGGMTVTVNESRQLPPTEHHKPTARRRGRLALKSLLTL